MRRPETRALMHGTPGFEVERALDKARRLVSLGRDEEARAAYLEVLEAAPADGRALAELGTLLLHGRFRAAARTVFERAVALAPDDPQAHVNLANVLFAENDYEGARAGYATALALDPELIVAHQGISYALTRLGREDAAREHRRAGFLGHAVSTQPYRGAGFPLNIVVLVCAAGGTLYTDEFLDDHVFGITHVVAEAYGGERLPRHAVVFNAISDADRAGEELRAMAAWFADWSVPVINPPERVLATSRAENARRLRELAGVRTAETAAVTRAALRAAPGPFPFLVRAPGYHTGEHFALVRDAAQLDAALATIPGDPLLRIEYLDLRDARGMVRKYRAMVVDGVLYPLHLAVSSEWKVHYLTSAMAAEESYRAEEARFLADPAAALGAPAIAALERVRDAIGLDFFGIDFALDPAGNVVVFEANATMIVTAPGPEPMWAYRRPYVEKVLAAAQALVLKRAT